MDCRYWSWAPPALGLYVLGLRRSGLAASEAIRRMLPDAVIQGADDAPDIDRDRLAMISGTVQISSATSPSCLTRSLTASQIRPR